MQVRNVAQGHLPGQPYSPSPQPHVQGQHRVSPYPGMHGSPAPRQYAGQGNVAPMPGSGQMPGPTGYHTVMSEVQQHRMLEQAKARMDAQMRSQGFADKMVGGGGSRPAVAGLAGIGLGGAGYESHIAARVAQQQKVQTPPVRNGVPPSKITPVPVPSFPGMQQRKPVPAPIPSPAVPAAAPPAAAPPPMTAAAPATPSTPS